MTDKRAAMTLNRTFLTVLLATSLAACSNNPLMRTSQATSTDAAQSIDDALAEAEAAGVSIPGSLTTEAVDWLERAARNPSQFKPAYYSDAVWADTRALMLYALARHNRVLAAEINQLASSSDLSDEGAATLLRTADAAAETAGRVVGGVTGRRSSHEGPLVGTHGQQRRVVSVHTELAAHRAVRDVHGGTVNDVILATVAGGLRGWLMTRHESLGGLRRVRAVVPVSVIDSELEATSLGSQIAPHFVDLPIGEPSPVVRLHQVSYSFKVHKETGRGVAANRLAGIAGFAPARNGGDFKMPLPWLPQKAMTVCGCHVGSSLMLRELVDLVKTGKVKEIPVETRPLSAVNDTLADLHAGRITGRVVLTTE